MTVEEGLEEEEGLIGTTSGSDLFPYHIPRSLNPLIFKPSQHRCSWIQGNGQSLPFTHVTQPPKETGSLSIDI